MTSKVPHYFPQFLRGFWLSSRGDCDEDSKPRLHGYDVYSNELFDILHSSMDNTSSRPIFHDFDDSSILAGTLVALKKAQRLFLALENQAEKILQQIITYIQSPTDVPTHDGPQSVKEIPVEKSQLSSLMKFFVFLRFRNSSQYRQIISGLSEDRVLEVHSGTNSWNNVPGANSSAGKQARVSEIYGPLWRQVRCQAVLNAFVKFFETDFPSSTPLSPAIEEKCFEHSFRMADEFITSHQWNSVARQPSKPKDPFLDLITSLLWNFCQDAEMCFGLSEGQEFILPDSCYGILDESFGQDRDPSQESLDCFFPILPTLALYIMGGMSSEVSHQTTIQIGIEQPSDVYLRNAMILSVIPQSSSTIYSSSRENVTFCGPQLYFSSLSSITRSISSYDEFRCRQFYDYSRLKQMCRHRFLKESVSKTLVIKEEVRVWDLTDQVEFLSKAPCAFGAFSDVWQGKWWDGSEGKHRTVAIKVLRRVMVKGVLEKLYKRLQAEVVTWHRLCHRNVAPFYGVVSTSDSIGMVSEWCVNGTVESYLKENPRVDRLLLLIQIASGVAYLHEVQPQVVHGDLKGGNILIDGLGRPIITDFGLSKVLSSSVLVTSSLATAPEILLSSSFGGSTRWMAPELIGTLLEDRIPQVTTESDVWAFGSVCLEIITGQLPYPQRTNNASVTIDISRGIKPSRGARLVESLHEVVLNDEKTAQVAGFLDSCWDDRPSRRPKMADACKILVSIDGIRADSV